ncbi:YIP1 family protein [Gemmatimonadota bacterium]
MNENTGTSLPSLPVRLVKVFFSPGELFAALREKPVWFGALAVVAALVAVSMALVPAEVWEQMIREQAMEQAARTGREIPEGFGAGTSLFRFFSILGPLITTFIWAFLLAGIVTFVFAFIFGDDGKYSQYLSVVSHAMVIGAVGALLTVPLKIAQQDISLTLSVGTFFYSMGDGYLHRVLNMLDLFQLWAYGVMAIGVTKIDSQRSLGFALSFFGAFALVFALIFGLFQV